ARRRRGEGRRGERGERAERGGGRRPATEVAEGANLIVLPGERVSRVASDTDEPAEDDVVELAQQAETKEGNGEQQGEGGRRRRRRRGGRGRGRGRRAEGEAPAQVGPGGEPLDEAGPEEAVLE